MQAIALILPPSYVFEGMRSVVAGQGVPWDRLAIGGVLALVYLVLACMFFFAVYRTVIRNGLIARYSAETVSSALCDALRADTVRTRCDISDSPGGTNRSAERFFDQRGIMSQRLKAVFATILILAAGLFALAAEAQQPAPNPRIALVIGNATYRDAALGDPRQRCRSRRPNFAGGGI